MKVGTGKIVVVHMILMILNSCNKSDDDDDDIFSQARSLTSVISPSVAADSPAPTS